MNNILGLVDTFAAELVISIIFVVVLASPITLTDAVADESHTGVFLFVYVLQDIVYVKEPVDPTLYTLKKLVVVWVKLLYELEILYSSPLEP